MNQNGYVDLDNPDTPEDESEFLQENHYYPFGMDQLGNWVASVGSKNDYLYNGKEKDDETGWYYYGARWYDPSIGRWNAVDALAIVYHDNTPYNYALNNPIYFKDPDGRKIITHDGKTQNQILANIADQLGANSGFYFNKNGVLKIKRSKFNKAMKGFNEEQIAIADGLKEVIDNEDRVIEIQVNEDSDNFTVDIYEPGFAKNEDGSFVMDKGIPKREGWQKTGYEADLSTKNTGGALFWTPGSTVTTKTKAYGYILMNRKTVSTLQIKAEGGKLTAASESSALIHEALDHGLDFIRTGNINKSSGPGIENVKYHNKALKNISNGKSPLRTTHYD